MEAVMEALAEPDPREAAAKLAAERDGEWVRTFSDELDRRVSVQQLERVMSLWHLSRSELGGLFGVSRQAVSKWISDGVPAERATQVGDLLAITDLLSHYLKRDRIPAVVRRRAPGLMNLNLIELLSAGHSGEALRLTRQMFTFADAHR